MKRKTLIFTIVNILMVILLTITTVYCTKLQNSMSLSIYLGESHLGQKNIAQFFYSSDTSNWRENTPLTVTFKDNLIVFQIGEVDFGSDSVRIDPFNQQEDFSIQKVDIAYGEHTVFSMQGKDLKKYIEKARGVSCKQKGELLVCTAKNDNPRMLMKETFSEKLYQYYLLINVVPYVVIFLVYLILGILEIKLLKWKEKGRYLPGIIISTLVLCIGVIVIYALQYFEDHFGQVPFGQLVYHLHTPLDGTDISSYQNVILLGVVLTVCIGAVFNVICLLLKKKQVHRGFVLWGGFLGVLLCAYGGVRACLHFDIIEYYQYTHSSTELYEEYYADGREVELTFPETKRNLIYIFLESMEITYADTASGGAMQENYIPELTKIALDNNCFSDGTGLNGAYHVSGATYTMGALAAQTCGVPINESLVSNDALNSTWESENNYLPGVWSIGDILKEQGYNQEFLIGSVGGFAGRTSYFKGHGDYDVQDYNSAIEQNRIPSDYKVWWGYEDEKLFAFAKEDIIKLAEEKEPFNFTMLTVDTHFTDGYVCDVCEDTYSSQYSNVIACSSRQVAEFIDWIQKQDFYENTTIVLAGDHLTPDSYYIANEGASGFDRKAYFTIINPAAGKESSGQKRAYTTLDLYPTTLSSLGVNIEGNRLGLGVDLYSDTPTLMEEYNLEYLNTELLKNSEYYTKKLLYK